MHAEASGSPPAGRRALGINIAVRTLLVAAAFIAVGWALVSIRATVMTLFFALFAAFVLDPVVRASSPRIGLGRGLTATIVVLSLVVLGVVIAFLLLSPFVEAMTDFVDALPSIVQDIRDSSLGSWVDDHSGAPEEAQANVKEIAEALGDAAGGVAGVVVSGFTLILSLVTAIFLTLFLIIDMPRLFAAVDGLLDPGGSDRCQRIMPAIITAVSRTMLGNIAISIICGMIYGVSAWLLGPPFPLAIAVIAGFLDLIPMVGATDGGRDPRPHRPDPEPDAGGDHARDRARLPAVRELPPAADDPGQGGRRLGLLRDCRA